MGVCQPAMLVYQRVSIHQTCQVPKMEVLTYISCMYGLCKGKPHPKIAENKVQETLHFRYLKFLVKHPFHCWNPGVQTIPPSSSPGRCQGSTCTIDLCQIEGGSWRSHVIGKIHITPWKFNSSPLKNGGWKTSLSYWDGPFSGANW